MPLPAAPATLTITHNTLLFCQPSTNASHITTALVKHCRHSTCHQTTRETAQSTRSQPEAPSTVAHISVQEATSGSTADPPQEGSQSARCCQLLSQTLAPRATCVIAGIRSTSIPPSANARTQRCNITPQLLRQLSHSMPSSFFPTAALARATDTVEPPYQALHLPLHKPSVCAHAMHAQQDVLTGSSTPPHQAPHPALPQQPSHPPLLPAMHTNQPPGALQCNTQTPTPPQPRCRRCCCI